MPTGSNWELQNFCSALQDGKGCLSLGSCSTARGSFPLLPMPVPFVTYLLTLVDSEKEVENKDSEPMGCKCVERKWKPSSPPASHDAERGSSALLWDPGSIFPGNSMSAFCCLQNCLFSLWSTTYVSLPWLKILSHSLWTERAHMSSFGEIGFFPQFQLLTRATLCSLSPARNAVCDQTRTAHDTWWWDDRGSKSGFDRHPWWLHCLARSLLPTTTMFF